MRGRKETRLYSHVFSGPGSTELDLFGDKYFSGGIPFKPGQHTQGPQSFLNCLKKPYHVELQTFLRRGRLEDCSYINT